MIDRARQIVLWLMILLFTMHVEGGAVAWGLYGIFADQIAAVYCVNPTNPCCHGKCHMVSSTEKERKQGGATLEAAFPKVEAFVADRHVPPPLVTSAEPFPQIERQFTSTGFPRSLDHPPSILL